MEYNEFKKKRMIRQVVTGIFFIIILAGGWFWPYLGYFIPLCMVIGLLMAVRNGRKWCDWYCPRGGFYDSIVSPFSPKKRIPGIFKNYVFRFSMIAILMGIMGRQITFVILKHGSFFEIGRVFVTLLTVTTVLGVILAVFFHQRSWCYLCPIGTISGCIGKGRNPIKIDPALCSECGLCSKVCPVQIEPSKFKKDGVQSVSDGDCVKCGQCVAACPKKALMCSSQRKIERVSRNPNPEPRNPKHMFFLVLLVIFISAVSVGPTYAVDRDWEYWSRYSGEVPITKEVSYLVKPEWKMKNDMMYRYLFKVEQAVAFKLNKYLELAPYYVWQENKTTKGCDRSDLFYLDMTGKLTVKELFDLKITDRARYQYNLDKEATTWRNSAKISKVFNFGKYEVSPFVEDEIFFDPKIARLSENWASTGIAVAVDKHTSLSLAYLLDTKKKGDDWTYTNVLVSSLSVKF